MFSSSTHSPPRTERGATKAAARIKASAVEAFSENGFGGTSTRDIAKRLGMSPAAMYPHFATKEALLFAISLDGHQRAFDAVSTAANGNAANGSARLGETVAAFARWQAENNSLARVVQYEIRSLAPQHYREVAALRRKTSALIESIIDEGVRSGIFRPVVPADAALAITSLCVDICRWFPSSQHSDIDQLTGLYADLAMRMVG